MMEWRVLATTHGLITLRSEDAVLVIEASRVDVTDPDLEGAISRLAPLLGFAPCIRNGAVIERIADHDGERVVVGRFARGTTSVAYIVTSREPIEVADVIAHYVPELPSPFDHFAE
jgi:hypothetical protein